MSGITFRFAVWEDIPAIHDLLASCDLPCNGISAIVPDYIVACYDKTLVGSVGLEGNGDDALLRSLAVHPIYRKQGIGSGLIQRIVSHAHQKNIRNLYLLTLTAQDYFARHRFKSAVRADAPPALQKTAEFRNLCPVSAFCMRREIEHEIQYHPSDVLLLQEDVPGAGMWAISLNHTMLTYFEVEPGCRFERHSHESEQITMVLAGELVFETNSGIERAGPGDVIAIPSGIPHAVFTKEATARAIDAWSPLMKKYRR